MAWKEVLYRRLPGGNRIAIEKNTADQHVHMTVMVGRDQLFLSFNQTDAKLIARRLTTTVEED